jgi:hypothetical protein
VRRQSTPLYLGIKTGRKELELAWKSLRRGWYVGGEDCRIQRRAGGEADEKGWQNMVYDACTFRLSIVGPPLFTRG